MRSTLNTIKMFDLVGLTGEKNTKRKATKNGRNFKPRGSEMKLQDRDA